MNTKFVSEKTLPNTTSRKQDRSSMWFQLAHESKTYENSLDSFFKRSNGIYYTNLDLAKYMIDEIFTMNPNLLNEIENRTFFEPCVGTGNFVFAYLLKIHELNFSPEKNFKIISNIFVNDIDVNALEKFQDSFISFTKILFNFNLVI